MFGRLGFALIFILFLTSTSFADISKGIIGWWKLDDASGTTAKDSSYIFGATEHDGTLTGSQAWTSGKRSGAFNFNGSSEYFTVADTAVLELTNSYSITAWVKPATLHNYGNVLMKYNGGSSGYGIISFATGEWDFQPLGQTGPTTPAGSLVNGTWAFLTVTYDGTNCRLYQNAVLKTTLAISALTANNVSLFIGTDLTNSRYFNGIIDDVRIYNRPLSAGEIWDIYQGGSNKGGE